MEARHAIQGALRTASSTRVTAALLALRQTTAPTVARQRSSSTASSAAAAAAAAPSTSISANPVRPRVWPDPNPRPARREPPRANTPLDWIKPRPSTPSSFTIGGGRGSDTIKDFLTKVRTRAVPLGSAIPAEVSARGGGRRGGIQHAVELPPIQLRFNTDEFQEAQRLRGAANEWHRTLRPSLGRTVPCGLGSSVDAQRAFGLLNFLVRRNNVAKDVRSQRFHERGGLKRKRLRSERWRARFKVGFLATVKRVRELTKQGW